MVSADAELAKEFFSIANIITGFYIAQTLLFLNSLRTDMEFRTILYSKPAMGRKYTWGFAGIYVLAVAACTIAEILLRRSAVESETVRFIAIGAGVSRLAIILAVAGICQSILSRVKPPASAEGRTPENT